MVARLWRGWTAPANAQAYEELLRSRILPGLSLVGGYRGVYLLRRDVGGRVEFATLTLWDSMDAVREFAGEDFERAVVPADAQALLADFDHTSVHYETLVEPG